MPPSRQRAPATRRRRSTAPPNKQPRTDTSTKRGALFKHLMYDGRSTHEQYPPLQTPPKTRHSTDTSAGNNLIGLARRVRSQTVLSGPPWPSNFSRMLTELRAPAAAAVVFEPRTATYDHRPERETFQIEDTAAAFSIRRYTDVQRSRQSLG
ncbi:hypothetical protein FQA47_018015 [Oryzias melastigma]|uniref:Uncharacterized protein n=1 Tax=Oryzias melastigma TaxID=30732 RepID=A0A834F4F2_ORYME|nr:hypothetical protein FQA47_018015 [Oryzias melastigma]